MPKIKFIIGNSFQEIFENLTFEHKEDSKEILSNLIFEPEKVSAELIKSKETLKQIFEEALDICFTTLYPKNISLYIFPTNNNFIIEEMNGISGFAPYQNNIFLFINQSAFQNKEKIKETILHEFNHTCFYEKHTWNSLLDSFIAEGLADLYTIEILKSKIPDWSNNFSLNEIKQFWPQLKDKLDQEDLHSQVFWGSENKFPNWLGYSIGFQILNLFRKHHPNLTWKEILNHTPKQIFNLSQFEKALTKSKSIH